VFWLAGKHCNRSFWLVIKRLDLLPGLLNAIYLAQASTTISPSSKWAISGWLCRKRHRGLPLLTDDQADTGARYTERFNEAFQDASITLTRIGTVQAKQPVHQSESAW
jgi:hypothetical protein